MAAFIELKKRHHCLLYIDEAHSLGVLGAHGRGIGDLAAALEAGLQNGTVYYWSDGDTIDFRILDGFGE